MNGPYGSYKGRCVGMLLNVLHEYMPMTFVDRCTFGDGIVYLDGRELAKITWTDCTDFPQFQVTDMDRGELLAHNQIMMYPEVYEAANPTNLLEEAEEKIKELERKLFGVRLYAQMCHKDDDEEDGSVNYMMNHIVKICDGKN